MVKLIITMLEIDAIIILAFLGLVMIAGILKVFIDAWRGE